MFYTYSENKLHMKLNYLIKLFTICTMESQIIAIAPHLLSEYRQGTMTEAKSGGDGIIRCDKSNHNLQYTH